MSEIDVVVARLGRAHGLRGEIMADLRTDSPESRFRPGAVLWADQGRPLTVRGFRFQKTRGVLSFAEVRDRVGAEALTGAELTARVDPGEPTDEADAFHDHQLMGLDVVTTDGVWAGSVERVDHLDFQDLLAVRTAIGVRLIPFVDDLVPEVDLAAGRLVVRAIPGLLEDEL